MSSSSLNYISNSFIEVPIKLLADKIELLQKNETLRKEMGEKARKFAQKFGMVKYGSELLSVYKS